MAELTRVLAIEPNHANANYEYGKAKLAAGDLPAAVEHLERAAKAGPSKPYIHYQLGRAYFKVGRQRDAEREFARVRELRGITK
jgi:Flp pilus assembly protein TadD